AADQVISVPLTTGTRAFGILSVVGTTINLKEALDGNLADGATVTKYVSQNATPGTRGSTPDTQRLKLYEQRRFNAPEVTYHNIVYVDTSRGAGQHRLYYDFPSTGWMGASTKHQIISGDALPINGSEGVYTKSESAEWENVNFDDCA